MVNSTKWDILILGAARDFHAMDWYRAIKRICPDKTVVFLTDSFQAEGLNDLSEREDNIRKLLIIDRFLLKKLSPLSHGWRNAVKFFIAPLQAVILRYLHFRHGRPIVHAHPMYFMLLSKLAGIPYIGTPQGAELLDRPKTSLVYRSFSSWLLRNSKAVIVDSEQMKLAAKELANIDAHVFQNGVNVGAINRTTSPSSYRYRVVSGRGMTSFYQIDKLIAARNASLNDQPITFVYPFSEPEFYRLIKKLMCEKDEDLGRLEDKSDLYALLKETLLVVSIPFNDSSPRSVYEAIFSGCTVAAIDNPWIHALPESMKKRVVVVDLEEKSWLKRAFDVSVKNSTLPFVPCNDALALYDEESSLRRVVNLFY